jgi:hypothetical protein
VIKDGKGKYGLGLCWKEPLKLEYKGRGINSGITVYSHILFPAVKNIYFLEFEVFSYL